MNAFKLLGASAAAALMVGVSAASASVTFEDIDLTGPGSDAFQADLVDEPGLFDHDFDFTLSDPAAANAVVSTIKLNNNEINLSALFLDGFAFTKIFDDGITEVWNRSAVTLGAGPHTLNVQGSVVGSSGDGSYSGVINIAAIPEPGTWALMIAGFGGAGAMLRSRRRAIATA